MSTGIIYAIAEGLKGLRRAKFSAFASISTIFLSLILIGFFIIFILNARRLINQLQSRMELEIFIDNSYTIEQVEGLRRQIINIDGIDSIRFVSKEEAANIFKEQFGQDIFEILDENPLPASFQVKVKPMFRSATQTKIISEEINRLEGVDEVLYRQDLLVFLEKYSRILLAIVLGMGLLIAIGSIFLVSNTIKLIIFSRSTIIEIMKLVGATRRFIRRPFVVEGIVQGFIGGSLAALFFYILFKIIQLEIPGIILINQENYIILLALGLLFGLIGSLIALRKFLQY